MAITLNNGFKMPIIGLGVWRMQGQEIKDLIINSIKIGYRHFDCAGNFSFFLLLQIWKLTMIFIILTRFECVVADYKNETEVGEALKEAFDTGLVKREELFITTKVNFHIKYCLLLYLLFSDGD